MPAKKTIPKGRKATGPSRKGGGTTAGTTAGGGKATGGGTSARTPRPTRRRATATRTGKIPDNVEGVGRQTTELPPIEQAEGDDLERDNEP